MATNKLEGESCQKRRLTNWRGKVAKNGNKLERKTFYAKIGKMLPDTKLPKMVICVENPYQCFQRVYKEVQLSFESFYLELLQMLPIMANL